jgi:Predicted transcriptional regulators
VNSVAFRDRLKALRMERGITQEDLAKALNVPASSIRRYESSDEQVPKRDRLEAIADYFDCSVDYLLERTDERKPKESAVLEYTLSDNKIDFIIKETEKEYGVNLRDDPVVEDMVREVLRSLAKMKKRD